jgi:tetratricopeptide (TPR) repeat protein
MRYRLLQTIRQFAAEQLDALGLTASLQLRHARDCTAVFSEQVARLHGEHHAEAMATLELEHDNARAAFDWLTQQRRFDLALRLGKALADHWFVRGVLADGVARLERLLSLPPPDSVELALLVKQAGVLAMYLGRQDLALTWLEWGLRIAREAGQGVLEAGLLGGLGSLATARGELPVARQHYEASLALCRRLGDSHGEANAHNNLGIVLGELGEIAAARVHLEAALELHRATHSRTALANGLMSLAELEQLAEQPDRAQALLESSLDIFVSQGDDWSAAYARDGLGKCALDRGDLAAARQHFEQALGVLRGLGDKGAIADQLDYLAQVARQEGRQADALRLVAESLALRLALNNARALSASFQTLAELQAVDQPERAARLFGAMQAQQARSGAARNASRRQREQALLEKLTLRLGATAFERLASEGAAADPAGVAGAA